MKRLKGEVAIITGASSGIGQATAIAFAAEGASVAVLYWENKKGAEATLAQITKADGKGVVIKVDAREQASVEAAFKSCRSEFGDPTLLVNSAGVDAGGIEVTEMDLEHWEDVLRTNLTGPFLFCRAFARGLKASKKKGKIVNISSVHQEIPRIGAADYDASKGGLRNLTRTLALELAPHGINVNNLAPGMVLTPMNQPALDDPKVLKEQVQSIPLKRAAEPDEVAELAVYLCSKAADYVTGSTFVIDGGLMFNTGQGA